MKTVLCLDDGNKYLFNASTSREALEKMLYCLNLYWKDDEAKIEQCNNRTWCLTHKGKTYAVV